MPFLSCAHYFRVLVTRAKSHSIWSLTFTQANRPKNTSHMACVASVSSLGSSRKLGQEQKKKWMIFFCFRSNFRAVITRSETLATQATSHKPEYWLRFQRSFPSLFRTTTGSHACTRDILIARGHPKLPLKSTLPYPLRKACNSSLYFCFLSLFFVPHFLP